MAYLHKDIPIVSERLYVGRLAASASEIVDAPDLLPHFELVAIPVLEGLEAPGEQPAIRRRLRAEGVRPREHRGTLLLEPGELDRISSVGMLTGGDEVYFSTVWNDEFEPFPARISGDLVDFREGPVLGLEEWMFDTQCLLAIGDGVGLNYATPLLDLHEKLASRWQPAKR